jgi:hypothetical protein
MRLRASIWSRYYTPPSSSQPATILVGRTPWSAFLHRPHAFWLWLMLPCGVGHSDLQGGPGSRPFANPTTRLEAFEPMAAWRRASGPPTQAEVRCRTAIPIYLAGA